MISDIIYNTNYNFGHCYDYHLGYYYVSKSQYENSDVKYDRDYSQTLKEYDFWGVFEKSKSQLANFLNPEWLNYLENQPDNSTKERTLYFLKICETQSINAESKKIKYNHGLGNIHEKSLGLLFKIVLPGDVKREGIKHHVLNDSGSFNFRGKCTVTVNNQEEREMSVNDMITFVKTHEGTNRCYRIKTDGVTYSDIKMNNKHLLVEFLENLYLCYRKIEKRLDYMGYEYDSTTSAVTLDDPYREFRKSIENYVNTVSNNIMEMYPIIRKLFMAYQGYLKLNMEKRFDFFVGEITREIVDKLKKFNEKLNITINSQKLSQKLNNSFASISSYGIKLDKFNIKLNEKITFIKYMELLDLCIGKIDNKLYASGLKMIPWYEITPVEGDELIQKYTSELIEVKDQNVIDIYPVIVKLYQSYCSFIGECTDENLDFNLSKYLEEATLKSLIDKLENWTVIYCGNFILSEPYGWYTFDKEFKQLNSKLEEENKNKFVEFLINLYKFYTKIETKLNEVGYDKIYHFESDPFLTYRMICKELDKAFEDYRSKPKNSPLLAVYPLAKKLYCCYIEYLNYCLDNKIKIDEGVHLPGTSEKLKEWMETLDWWTLKKVGDEWQESIEPNNPKLVIQNTIMSQLKKHQNQHDDADNRKINAIIDTMKNFGEKSAVVSAIMEEIKNLNLDGDTNELINKFNSM